MTKKVTWIIDEVLLGRHDHVGFPTIASAALELGHDVIRTKYQPFTDKIGSYLEKQILDNKTDNCIIVYGCVGFLKLFNNWSFGCPGSYFKTKELEFSFYASNPQIGPYILNHDYFILPYGTLMERIRNGLPIDYDGRLFIRPNSVTKTFAGRVFEFGDLSDHPDSLAQYEPVSDNELCIVAAAKNIEAEFRHIIVDRKVISSSQYRRNNVLDIRIDVNEQCLALAEKITNVEWQPDYVYVVDTALSNGSSYIVEYNTFSCAGLYACDTRKVVEAVSEMAWKEMKGDL